MRKKYGISAIALVAALALTGCVDNTVEPEAPESNTEVGIDEAAAALLPDDIREAGVLIGGTTHVVGGTVNSSTGAVTAVTFNPATGRSSRRTSTAD